MTDKKSLIMKTAEELFALKGFEGTSIRELATAADVNVAMINYYFGSKEKLFECMVETRVTKNKDILQEIAANKLWSTIEKLDRVIENHVERLFTTRRLHRVLHQEILMNQRVPLHESIVTFFARNAEIVVGIIEQGIKSGEVKKVDAVLTVASIFGTINHILLSKRMCKKICNMPQDHSYVPYEDPVFKKRVIKHLKQLTRSLLLK